MPPKRTNSEFEPTERPAVTALADVVRAVEQVHACLDAHVAETRAANAAASQKRHAMGNAIMGLQGGVSTLTGKVGNLEAAQAVDSGRIDRLAKLFGAEKVEKGERRPKGHGVATWPGWKLFGAVGGAISLVAFCYQLGAAVGPDLAHNLHHFLMTLKP